MRLAEALDVYKARTIDYDNARRGIYLYEERERLDRCKAAGVLVAEYAVYELPALLAVVDAARTAHRVLSADWDGPVLRTLGAALAALDQIGKEDDHG